MKVSNSQLLSRILANQGISRWKCITAGIFLFIGLFNLYKVVGFLFKRGCDVENDIFSPYFNCNQDDLVVLNRIRKHHLIPPSNKKYNLSHKVERMDGSVKEMLRNVLKFQESGFFVECGANNGEFLSNTIELETTYGWQGLLIEASPSLFQEMKTKNRKAWLADVCLSSELPEQMEFTRHKDVFPEWRIGVGRVNPEKTNENSLTNPGWTKDDFVSEGMVECFSLYSVLKALNVETVDFFSLDVEGHELRILKAIPYDLVNIKTIYVENRGHTTEDKSALKELLLENGYILALDTGTDYLFVKGVTEF